MNELNSSARKLRARELSVVIPVEDMYDEFYLGYLCFRLRNSGIRVSKVGPCGSRRCRGRSGLTSTPVTPLDNLKPHLCDGLIIPVSYAPSHLKIGRSVINLVKLLASSGKTIAALTLSFRAVWLLASADVLRGRRMVASPSSSNLAIQAGATILDGEYLADGCLITCARPHGLCRFMTAVTNALIGSGEIGPLFSLSRVGNHAPVYPE